MELEMNIQVDNVSFRVTLDPIPRTTGRSCPAELSAPFCLHVIQGRYFTGIQGVHLVCCQQQRDEEKESSCVGVQEERHSLLVLGCLRTREKKRKTEKNVGEKWSFRIAKISIEEGCPAKMKIIRNVSFPNQQAFFCLFYFLFENLL